MQELKQYTQYLPEVKRYLGELEHQDLWWTTVAMVGKINNENIDPQLLESIVDTQKEFQSLRNMMIEALVSRYLNQANSEIVLKSQATIDILIRNLFERTADVGFLATDDDLVDFLANPETTENDADFIHRRIEEYVAKYSVYDDILLLDTRGQIRAKLNPNNPVTMSRDPIIQEALTTNEPYTEVYRHSDLFPNKPKSLIYAKRIEATVSGESQTVGVLCLSFEFDEEMESIFPKLSSAEEGYEIMILDDQGSVIATNNPVIHPLDKKFPVPEQMRTPKGDDKGLNYITQTHGYQGFKGLPWFCYTHAAHSVAFASSKTTEDLGVTINEESPIYLRDLDETNLKVSTLLLIVILNGKITSLKKDVKSFLPVLDSFQDISRDIQAIFSDFIHHIHTVLVETIQNKVKFSATLAIEIMDRNLYERANDCRWWALNSTFRKVLTDHQDQTPIEEEETETLTDILQYINQLYTVYTNIMLYDRKGKILAVSNPAEAHLIGTILPQPQDTSACLGIQDTQAYVVSDFHKTELYNGRYTYIYHAAVKHWHSEHKNVGGIALVFDSEPEFLAMLEDTKPKYINKTVDESTFCLFTTPDGEIIASTTDTYPVGTQITLPDKVKHSANGDSGSLRWDIGECKYIMGYKMSEGYREYKNGDGYTNNVLSLVFTGI
ncbi:MAG: cache domain-containing protein [Hydrogenovibrio sp.]